MIVMDWDMKWKNSIMPVAAHCTKQNQHRWDHATHNLVRSCKECYICCDSCIDFRTCFQHMFLIMLSTKQRSSLEPWRCCVDLLALSMLWLSNLCLTVSCCSCRHDGLNCRSYSRRDIGTSSACASILKLQKYCLHGNGQPYTNLLLCHLSSCRFASIIESCKNDVLRFHVPWEDNTTLSRWKRTIHTMPNDPALTMTIFFGLHIYSQYAHQEKELLQHLLFSLCQSMY